MSRFNKCWRRTTRNRSSPNFGEIFKNAEAHLGNNQWARCVSLLGDDKTLGIACAFRPEDPGDIGDVDQMLTRHLFESAEER